MVQHAKQLHMINTTSILQQIVHFWASFCTTSNVTGHPRGPKWKLPACYRVPSLQCTSYVWIGLLCRASSIFHRRVWYHTLSLCMYVLCTYSKFGYHPHPLGYPCAKFCFCRALHCWASLWRKPHTHSFTHSPNLFDVPGTKAFASVQITFIGKFHRTSMKYRKMPNTPIINVTLLYKRLSQTCSIHIPPCYFHLNVILAVSQSTSIFTQVFKWCSDTTTQKHRYG